MVSNAALRVHDDESSENEAAERAGVSGLVSTG